MVVPAIMIVLVSCVLALYSMSVRTALVDVAAQVARQSARGDSDGEIRQHIQRTLDGAEYLTSIDGDLVCATANWAPPHSPGWLGDAVGTVESCALREVDAP